MVTYSLKLQVRKLVDLYVDLGDNRGIASKQGNEMKSFLKDLAQATVMAVLAFGPLFYYFLFVMKP
jgi:hypothetical protein